MPRSHRKVLLLLLTSIRNHHKSARTVVQTGSRGFFCSGCHDNEPHRHGNRAAASWSSSSDETDRLRKASPHKREKRKAPVSRPQAQESQYETGYTTGDTGNERDQDYTEHLFR